MTERWHGTPGGYRMHGCRCDRCRAANTIDMRAVRARRKARGVCLECNTPTTFRLCLKHRQAHNEGDRRAKARKAKAA